MLPALDAFILFIYILLDTGSSVRYISSACALFPFIFHRLMARAIGQHQRQHGAATVPYNRGPIVSLPCHRSWLLFFPLFLRWFVCYIRFASCPSQAPRGSSPANERNSNSHFLFFLLLLLRFLLLLLSWCSTVVPLFFLFLVFFFVFILFILFLFCKNKKIKN